MIIEVRGYKIQCYGNDATRAAYKRLYESMSDEWLAMAQEESNDRQPIVGMEEDET